MSDKSESPTPYFWDSDYFDPNFSEVISRKMTVPKCINIDGVNDMPNRKDLQWIPDQQLDMRVPEKIVVAESHYGRRTHPTEIVLDNTIPSKKDLERLQTPPRVLTIDSNSSRNVHINLNNSMIMEGMKVSEEIVHLRKQLAKLNRRVISLELENLKKKKYDKIFYSLGIAYLFFKIVFWLRRS